MDSSRIKNLVFQSLKRKHQNGSTIQDAGAHMFHAATGVTDGGKQGTEKGQRLKKQFARLRTMKKETRDEGTHRYSNQGKDGSSDGGSPEREGTNYLNRS